MLNFIDFNQNWGLQLPRWRHRASKLIYVLVCQIYALNFCNLRFAPSSLAIFCSSWSKYELNRTKNEGFLLNTQKSQNLLCLVKCLQITLKMKISYILVKALMGNFQFWGYWIIFWRGHRCKEKFWDLWDFSFYTYDTFKKWS